MNVDTENHHLHCTLINSRSVGNKAPHINDLITENKLDFLIISETWLCDDDIAKVSLITPNGYTTFTKSRDGRKGGGVAVICRDQFICSIPENVNDFQSFEYFQLDVLVKNKSFSLFPVYRPEPNIATMSTFFLEFSTLLEEISIIPHEILILGDFNIHIDDAQNPTTRRLLIGISMFLIQHMRIAIPLIFCYRGQVILL